MIQLVDLQAGYNAVPVLRKVSLSVEKGQVVTVFGPNGSGKSTLLRAISGFINCVSGPILFDGKEISSLPPHQRVELGIVHVSAEHRVFPFMTVLENLELGAFAGQARRYLRESMETVFGILPILKERQSQLAGLLSGGEQMMCAIGRGLMGRPKLLMLDEPTQGLAPTISNTVLQTIQSLKKEGMAVLLVEHKVRKALEIADYGYLLVRGAIVLEGEAQILSGDEGLKKFYLGLGAGVE